MEFNGTFLATIITFILFVFIMNRILYAPILEIMEKRKNFIDSNYKDAQENISKTEELTLEKTSKLNEARVDAGNKYSETVESFKSKKAEEISIAQDSAKNELDSAKEDLRKLSDEVKDGLKNSMTALATDIVEKVIGYRSEVQGFDNEKVSAVLWGEDK